MSKKKKFKKVKCVGVVAWKNKKRWFWPLGAHNSWSSGRTEVPDPYLGSLGSTLHGPIWIMTKGKIFFFRSELIFSPPYSAENIGQLGLVINVSWIFCLLWIFNRNDKSFHLWTLNLPRTLKSLYIVLSLNIVFFYYFRNHGQHQEGQGSRLSKER